jgi:hypothetical protein
MGNKSEDQGKKATDARTEPPTETELLDRADEQEDDRLMAEEADEVDDEDSAVVEDAREERVP